MAHKITVIDDNSQIKKSAAFLLVRRLLAEWVVFSVSIRRLKTRQIPRTTTARFVLPRKPYIPERMPALEVPGVHFEEPTSAKWKEEHRAVSFPSREDIWDDYAVREAIEEQASKPDPKCL